METIINVKDLTRNFNKLVAVDHVNFKVYRGEIFGFLGPNGAGKTTTIRMLTGVIEPTSGDATIENHDIKKESILSRAHIAVVPEEANVYLDLSIWHNVVLMAELYGLPKRKIINNANSFLDSLGLLKRKKQKARSLSKGLRQRLMLCAALVTEPEVLFLDEPTSGLDVHSQKIIRELVMNLNQKGLTVFLTTHNMEEADEMCYRVAIINKGKIAAIDTPENLSTEISSRQYVEVSFKNKLPDKSQLKNLKNVLGVEYKDNRFKLFTKNLGDVAIEIANYAQARKLDISHLNTRNANLEDVFLHLTDNKGGA